MTTLPVGLATPATASPTGPASPSAGPDFLALLRGLLDAVPAGGDLATVPAGGTVADAPPPGAAPAPTPAGGDLATVPAAGTVADAPLPGDDDTDAPDDDPTDATTTPVTNPLLVLPPALLQVGAPAPAPTPSAPCDATSTAPATGSDVSVTPVAGHVDRRATDAGGSGPSDGSGSSRDDRTTPGPPAAAATTAGSSIPAAVPADPTAASVAPAGTSATATTPTGQVQAPPTTPPLAAPPRTEHVTRQVFPEIVETVTAHTSASGPSRVTIRLQPEALGEVRVVLSTHGGALRVSLAASGDAHRALLEGTPELRRLLESVGSPDARVVVRDLPPTAPAAPTTSAPLTDLPHDLAGGAGPGTGRPGGDQSPDRPPHGRITATDGTHDATNPSRRPESVTRARTTGLDVTM